MNRFGCVGQAFPLVPGLTARVWQWEKDARLESLSHAAKSCSNEQARHSERSPRSRGIPSVGVPLNTLCRDNESAPSADPPILHSADSVQNNEKKRSNLNERDRPPACFPVVWFKASPRGLGIRRDPGIERSPPGFQRGRRRAAPADGAGRTGRFPWRRRRRSACRLRARHRRR